uniref:Translation initiation factor IF-3 n=1 Tax=candidate division WOR-3 bacterium TaxID=2052148 RepID=A0A7C6E9M3_UNCW3
MSARDGSRVSHRPRANEAIRVPYVRVIGTDKKMIGVLPIREAILLARRQGMDLVEVSPNADPPVCLIADYGKYIYELKCREKESRKKQRSTEVREMRLRMKIGRHDYLVKLAKIKELLANRDRVRVSLILRGREVLHRDLAMKLIEQLTHDLADVASVESEPKVMGEKSQTVSVMFIPK